MSVTIKTIAKLAGVSSAAVSKALNGHSDISDETKNKILKISKEIGYTPNAIARSLVTQKSNTIGLLIPNISTPIYAEIFKGLDNGARELGYSLFLCNTNDDIEIERDYVRNLMEKRVNGIIIAPVSENIDDIVDITRNSIPVIYIGGKVSDNMNNYVIVDNLYGSRLATEYLIQLGHKDIYMLTYNKDTKTNRDRIAGYRAVMLENKIDPKVFIYHENCSRRECGYRQTIKLIESEDIPTAIFASNDMVALGVMEAALEKGLKIPDDISLIGYDDIVYASLPTIKLTTISQPKFEMGVLAIDLLFKMMNNFNVNDKHRRIVKPKLVIRNTCKSI